MVFRIAGWAFFGVTFVVFLAAETRARHRGTTPTGSLVPFLLVLAVTLGLGIAATATRSDLVTGLFVWFALVPWVGVYKKFHERRERQTGPSP